MRIMWLSPVAIPKIANECQLPIPASGGWIEGLISELRKQEDITIFFCFDTSTGKECSGVVDSISFFGFNEKTVDSNQFLKYIESFKPDLIHIFGTEKDFSYVMMIASQRAGLLDRTIISIQGLTSVIAKHYYAYLPEKIIHGWSFRDIVKHSNIVSEKKLFEKRGQKEKKALQIAKHVIGRTDWDYACVKKINPNVSYHKCNESLRSVFYEKKWDIGTCQKHSVFVSQYSYPLKGFHLMLEALIDVLIEYPDTHLYVTGNDPVNCSYSERLKQSNYEKYIVETIKKNRLDDYVTFCGKLDALQMRNRFLKSHVFVCCSSIENSSNSIGEAMLLGVPVVASDVGGVKSLLTHEKEGLLYQADAPYMLARNICTIFENDSYALELSDNEKKRAHLTHDPKINLITLIDIYYNIINADNGE